MNRVVSRRLMIRTRPAKSIWRDVSAASHPNLALHTASNNSRSKKRDAQLLLLSQ